jgi:hypothetical protein
MHCAICWSIVSVFITESTQGWFMYFRNGGSVGWAEILLIVNSAAIKGKKLFIDLIKLMIV